MRKTRRRMLVECCALLLLSSGLGGCASLSRRSREIPAADRQLDVPVVLQRDPRHCGVASLTMVARYYGQELAPAQHQRLVALADGQKALSGADLVSALKESGYYAALFKGTLDQTETSLYLQVDRGRPPIVMLESGPDARKIRHYVVIIGYYRATGDWLVADPQEGKRVIKADEFSRAWAQTDHFTLLAVPEGRQQANGGAR